MTGSGQKDVKLPGMTTHHLESHGQMSYNRLSCKGYWTSQQKCSPPEKRNKSRYCEFHKDHEHETKQGNELKKTIEQMIRNGKLNEFIDNASAKKSSGHDNDQRPWNNDKRNTNSNPSSSANLKVINVI